MRSHFIFEIIFNVPKCKSNMLQIILISVKFCLHFPKICLSFVIQYIMFRMYSEILHKMEKSRLSIKATSTLPHCLQYTSQNSSAS